MIRSILTKKRKIEKQTIPIEYFSRTIGKNLLYFSMVKIECDLLGSQQAAIISSVRQVNNDVNSLGRSISPEKLSEEVSDNLKTV